ncbi:hypothetical protein ABZ345_08690 [Lentzea sp. NPDC005914]|uniref:hypothetical protein n=1 Tax=Lentzea sp. NPDC005914 TaxID=3154572 RepID=UPI0033E14620
MRATLAELQKARTDLHRSHQVARCDMGLAVNGLRIGRPVRAPGLVVSGDCVCRDLVLDVLCLVAVFLTEHGMQCHNVVGAVRFHVRKRVIDVLRGYRASKGAQVKPKQVRQNRFGRALPDEEHRAVLGHLADEAGYTAPLPGQTYLLRRLAERCVAEFGNSVPYYLERMPAILRTVKSVCSAGNQVNVGTRSSPEYVSWYDAYIERPLGRRPESLVHPLSDEVTDVEPVNTDTDAAIVGQIVDAVTTAPSSDQLTSLRAAVHALADQGLIARREAEALLADRARLDDVLASAREVAHA